MIPMLISGRRVRRVADRVVAEVHVDEQTLHPKKKKMTMKHLSNQTKTSVTSQNARNPQNPPDVAVSQKNPNQKMNYPTKAVITVVYV